MTNPFIPYVIGLFFVVVALLLGVSIGSVSIPFSEVIQIFASVLFHYETAIHLDETAVNIVMKIRLPRVILAFIVGASLAISGAVFQGLLKNPLADPYTLGVSSGAAVGAVLVLFFGVTIFGRLTLPIMAILGGLGTIVLVLTFARLIQHRVSMETIILTGIIFSSFLGSLLSLMIALTGEELRQIIHWLLGSVAMKGLDYSFMLLPFFIVGSCLLLVSTTELNALSLGEVRAQHLGVHVERRKMLILIAASVLTGSAVAVSGTIGFVGLVVPHATRLLFGTDHRRLLPLSVLFGGGFLILADLVARTIVAPLELPIGVITAMIGAPVFGWILFQQRRERSD